MKVDQAPVTSSRPTQISMAPPILVTSRAWRRKNAKARIATWKPNDTSRNGTPSPRAYTKASRAPRDTVPVEADSASTAVSVGPMQGVQPSPNITPSSGAPARPARGRAEGRTMRPANENRSSAPANSRPRTMVTAPRICVSSRACPVSRCPRPPRAAPYATKTSENPSTNSAVPATTRPRGGPAGVTASGGAAIATAEPAAAEAAGAVAAAPSAVAVADPPAPAMPVTKDRYPGTSGRQHGDRKVTAPAAAATGSARISGPEVTSCPTPLTVASRGSAGPAFTMPCPSQPLDAGYYIT